VRLRFAYYVTCTEVIKGDSGEVVELRCTYDPATKGGWSEDGRKIKGTLHWVSARHAVPAEIRLYDRLFTKDDPMDAPEGQDFTANLNPDSLKSVQGYVEPALAALNPGTICQFERIGYFSADAKDHTPGKPVFNRTATLRDTWARIQRNM